MQSTADQMLLWCPQWITMGTTFTHLRVKLNRAFTLAGVVLDKNGTTDCYTGGTNDATATRLLIAALTML